jgi:AcrR family transcriptional regulator
MSVVSGVTSRVTDEELVELRRGQIVAAAVELFARRGYYRTTMLDVARKAGVSAGLIYQYVRDKDDVLLLVLLSVVESYRREIPSALEGLADPLERWAAAIRAYCRVVDERREATVLAYRSTKSLPPDRRHVIKSAELETNALISDTVRECIDAGVFRRVNLELVTYQMTTFAHAWALKHWRLRDVCDIKTYVREGIDLFAHALLTPAGWERWRALPPSRRGAVTAEARTSSATSRPRPRGPKSRQAGRAAAPGRRR